MEKLKLLRKTNRRLFTVACNDYESEENNISIGDKIFKLHLIERKAHVMLSSEEEYRQALFEECTDENIIDKEIDESEAYLDRWRLLEQKLAKLIVSEKENSVISDISIAENNRSVIEQKGIVSYPKLRLPRFDGNIKNWLGFWGQFQKIDKDPNLDANDKFTYLLQAMDKESSAFELVNSFPVCEASYEKAIKHLKNSFGREDLLIQVYVRDLLSLVLQKHNLNKRIILRTLYDQLEAKLRALEILGVARNKYACMLYPLVESSLPDEVLLAWERFRSVNRRYKEVKTESEDSTGGVESQESHGTDLELLLSFLQDEVEGEERISLASKGFSQISSKVQDAKSNYREENYRKVKSDNSSVIPSAAELFTTSNDKIKKCIFCSKSHHANDCDEVKKMSLMERQEAVKKSRSCFLCLKEGHTVFKCKLRRSCEICGKRHHKVLCRNTEGIRKSKSDENVEIKQIETSLVCHDEVLSTISQSPKVLLQTLSVVIRGKGSERTARAIIDSGAQRSFILKDLAKEMKYEPIRKECISHSLFGGTNTGVCTHDVYTIYLSNLDHSYNCNFEALSENTICESIVSAAKGPWLNDLKELKIKLTDYKEGPIEILVGADVAGKLLTGSITRVDSGLTAVETKLGWTLMGRSKDDVKRNDTSLLITNLLVKNSEISDLWTLDTLGIIDPSEKQTQMELHEAAKQHFLETVQVENGRFMVHLPWIEDHPPLPENHELALKRLNSTVMKLKSEGLFEAYGAVFKEWLEEEIIEEVPQDEMNAISHYLPHRHVVKEESTTKIRPVFDASAKIKGNPSLNECLEKGLNLIELIPSILMRFRREKIGVISDIRKAFLQISLHPKDKDFLRFIWKTIDEKLIYYRHCRVVFGVSSSPFLLSAVIQHHLQFFLRPNEKNDFPYPPNMVEKLLNSFYVDNCVTSVSSESELREFMQISIDVTAEKKFDLRGWESSDLTLTSPTFSGVLGLLWDRGCDTLQVNFKNFEDLCFEKITKRCILATAHRIFDPIGVTSPVVLLPKILLQQAWKMQLNWDQEVDEETRTQFIKWLNNLVYLKDIKIPRWLELENDKNNYSLHFFCDASRQAYAVVVFIRIETKFGVKVKLLLSRARVSPSGKKETTIARLELLGATIAARLAPSIQKEFPSSEVYFWSDSTTVLTWIKREESWGIFVHNRVQEIRRLTFQNAWRYVPGSINPADLPSRGCSAKYLLKSKWWEGPSWLYFTRDEWPAPDLKLDEDEIASEKKKKIVSSLMSTIHNDFISHRFSSFQKTVRVVAWIYRFIFNCRHGKNADKHLAVTELKNAEKSVLQLLQKEMFNGKEDPRLKSFHPFLENGIIRMRSPVFHRDDLKEFRAPAILSGEHPLVKSLIEEEHKKKGHAGISYVLNSIRERFWIICGRRAIRNVIQKCVTCRRFSAENMVPPLTSPPKDRVQDTAIFQVVGVDFAGPLTLRNGEKIWICLFTCAVYRAVHLELVASLATDSFLQAFHRFIARRGKPSVVYSDNGTNFKGAVNAFSVIDFDVVQQKSSTEHIVWKFIPPGAPWWGGWWERLIGLMKQVLKKILGKASLNYEEMNTILCNCEAILNDRPITAVTEDPEIIPLTPACFLREIQNDEVPKIKEFNSSNFCKRLRYLQNIREAFKKRFRQEYLGALQNSTPKRVQKQVLKEGDIVFIGRNDKKRLLWPLGRVLELLPGADGISRRARVKTKAGEQIRALQSLYPVEVSSADSASNMRDITLVKELDSKESNESVAKENFLKDTRAHGKSSIKGSETKALSPEPRKLSKKTRYGRSVNPPSKLSL